MSKIDSATDGIFNCLTTNPLIGFEESARGDRVIYALKEETKSSPFTENDTAAVLLTTKFNSAEVEGRNRERTGRADLDYMIRIFIA